MKIAIGTILLFLSTNSFSQDIDYLDIRDSVYNLNCGEHSMVEIANALRNLEDLDISTISKNKQEYYRNLGFTNYLYFTKRRDSSHIKKAIDAYEKAIEIDSSAYSSMWDLSLCYLINKQNEEGLEMLERYKATVPKSFFDKRQYKNTRKHLQKRLKI